MRPPEPRSPAPAEARSAATLRGLWLGAALLLLLFPVRYWTLQRPDGAPFVPDTPLERVNGEWAREFRFLRLAGSRVPPRARYSVVASDPIREMVPYMMSIGVVTHGDPVPSSYYGIPRREAVPADYLLSVDCVPPRHGGAFHVVARMMDGCVYHRSSKAR